MDTKMTRREALKIMGASVTGIAATSLLSPVAQARGIIERASVLPGFVNGYLEPDKVVFPAGEDAEKYYKEKLVYVDDDVVFRQIDKHTWHGHGHLCFNESIYIIEGEDKAIVLDAGTKVDNLSAIVASITSKPVTLIATHVHPDHTGSAINQFKEIYINAADTVNIPRCMPNYPGEIKYLNDGDVFDLGGREIEVIFTPGHTPGSTTFMDKANHIGFSGDAFGTTNLLLTTNFSTLICTTSRIAKYMEKYGIEKMYSGHYHGNDCETLQRVKDEQKMAEEMLEGQRKGEKNVPPSMGLNSFINDYGVTIRYRDPDGIK